MKKILYIILLLCYSELHSSEGVSPVVVQEEGKAADQASPKLFSPHGEELKIDYDVLAERVAKRLRKANVRQPDRVQELVHSVKKKDPKLVHRITANKGLRLVGVVRRKKSPFQPRQMQALTHGRHTPLSGKKQLDEQKRASPSSTSKHMADSDPVEADLALQVQDEDHKAQMKKCKIIATTVTTVFTAIGGAVGGALAAYFKSSCGNS